MRTDRRAWKEGETGELGDEGGGGGKEIVQLRETGNVGVGIAFSMTKCSAEIAECLTNHIAHRLLQIHPVDAASQCGTQKLHMH